MKEAKYCQMGECSALFMDLSKASDIPQNKFLLANLNAYEFME